MIPIGNDNPSRGFALGTVLLMGACIAVFVYQLTLPPEHTIQLVQQRGLVPQRFWTDLGGLLRQPGRGRDALLTVLSSMFLHGSLVHLLGNVWSLWLFGRELESRLGFLRYLVFYTLCGILAGLLHAALHPDSLLPTIGASGAIAGVMGGYFLLFPFNWITFLVPFFFIPLLVKLPAAFYLLVWIATQLGGGYQSLANGAPAAGGIAFWAHAGGFFSGMFLVRRRWLRRRAHLSPPPRSRRRAG